jgi:hypothetical protein
MTRYFSGDDPETLAAVGNVRDATARAKHPGWTWGSINPATKLIRGHEDLVVSRKPPIVTRSGTLSCLV